MATLRRTAVVLTTPLVALAIGAVWVPTGAAQKASAAPGALPCSATDAQFEQAGEDWMGRMLGSERAHDAMDQLMTSMMGSTGERQMHVYMGRRISGCGGAAVPGGFGQMMRGMGGMMGMMGGVPGARGGPGMMGGQGGGHGPGSMMGGFARSSRADDDDDDGPSAAAMVGTMAVLIGVVAVALLVFRPWRRRGGTGRSPADLLDRRFAAGEISVKDYEQRRKLLSG